MRTVVGVLRGGPSQEYEVSLKSGAAVLAHLDKEKYDARDLFVDRQGVWHSRGVPMDPERALVGVDTVFNSIHGEYGEDGNIQRILTPLGVPYTGAHQLQSALVFNKHTARDAVRNLGVRTPYAKVIESGGDPDSLARELFRTFPHPALVRPLGEGMRNASVLATSFHSLLDALQGASSVSSRLLIEEFIPGREASVGVIDNFRNEETYALLPVPTEFTAVQKEQMVRMAKQVHRGLDLRHFSQIDFTVSPRGIYVRHVSALPKLHSESRFVEALHSVGATLGQFLDHIVSLVHKR